MPSWSRLFINLFPAHMCPRDKKPITYIINVQLPTQVGTSILGCFIHVFVYRILSFNLELLPATVRVVG